MRKEKIHQISDDLLVIPTIIGRGVNQILMKSVFSAIEEDITPPHFGIMKMLYDRGERPISVVADWLQIPCSRMTHMVDKLENMGYVSRKIDTADRRSIKIKLTPAGKSVFREWVETVHQGTTTILNDLSDAEINALADSLATLRSIVVDIVYNHYREENGLVKT